MSGFYITLKSFIYEEFKDKFGDDTTSYVVKTKANYIQHFLKKTDLLSDDLLFDINLKETGHRLNERGTILSKYYDANNVPSDEVLLKDLNYFLDLLKYVINNYKDETEISVDEWVEVLNNRDVIDLIMYKILLSVYESDNHAATTVQIREKSNTYGFPYKALYNSEIVSNARRVVNYLNKKQYFDFEGKRKFWLRFFYGKYISSGFEYTMREELVKAFDIITNKTEKEVLGGTVMGYEERTILGDEKIGLTFYDYLLSQGYLFDKETIENYLLSLKVKPFAILTGNSGTGKTKLSQLFANYISSDIPISEFNRLSKNTENFVKVKVTTRESSWSIWQKINGKNREQNPGWTISNEFFYDYLPIDQFSGECEIEVDGIEGHAFISPVIQLYYDKNSSKLKKEFEKLCNLEKEIIKKDKENKTTHEVQLVDLELNVNSLKSMVNDDFKGFKGDFVFKKTVTSTSIKPGEFIIPYTVFEYLPFNKNQFDCKIISCGKFSNANIHIKFKLRKFSQNIKEYLERKGLKSEVEVKIKNIDTDLNKFNPDWSSAKKYSSEQILQLNDKDIKLIDFNSQNYKIIPVGANWTENRHIVGYYNVITNNYQSTPAYDLIKQAQRSDEPHFLILDEMNLSHVERYFADFLSAIESGENIPLYGENELEIPSNLFIIGTVNVDETTYMFSPKVLDRANVLEFETYSSMDYMLGKFSKNAPSGNIEYLENPLLGNEIREYGIDELHDLFSEVYVENNLLWDVLSDEITTFQSILKTSGFDFGFRVINEILRFMAVAWEYEGKPTDFTNWDRYFDACIKQKILPKLHGSEKIIGETLDELYKICLGASIESEDMAKYKESYKKLKEMRKVLRKQRYVSFIN